MPDMDASTFESWLAAYGRAWQQRDAQASAGLFTDDATYQVTPFEEPIRGRPAILEYWSHIARTEQNIQFGCEVLAVTCVAPDRNLIGIARWWASFVIVPPGLHTRLDGIFLISLDPTGRCQSLKEWWHKAQQ